MRTRRAASIVADKTKEPPKKKEWIPSRRRSDTHNLTETGAAWIENRLIKLSRGSQKAFKRALIPIKKAAQSSLKIWSSRASEICDKKFPPANWPTLKPEIKKKTARPQPQQPRWWIIRKINDQNYHRCERNHSIRRVRFACAFLSLFTRTKWNGEEEEKSQRQTSFRLFISFTRSIIINQKGGKNCNHKAEMIDWCLLFEGKIETVTSAATAFYDAYFPFYIFHSLFIPLISIDDAHDVIRLMCSNVDDRW